jgi:hypothetical protein
MISALTERRLLLAASWRGSTSSLGSRSVVWCTSFFMPGVSHYGTKRKTRGVVMTQVISLNSLIDTNRETKYREGGFKSGFMENSIWLLSLIRAMRTGSASR